LRIVTDDELLALPCGDGVFSSFGGKKIARNWVFNWVTQEKLYSKTLRFFFKTDLIKKKNRRSKNVWGEKQYVSSFVMSEKAARFLPRILRGGRGTHGANGSLEMRWKNPKILLEGIL